MTYLAMKNKLQILYVICGFIFFSQEMSSQTLSGNVANDKGEPVISATVILQSLDSVYSMATITDVNGMYHFTNIPRPYRLRIQHIEYKSFVIEDTILCNNIILDNNEKTLGEVVVTSSQPVKVSEDGALQYDAKTILRHHPSTSVFDLLDGLPTVNRNGSTISIVGTSSTTILINGRKRNINEEQLHALLMSVPASKVKKIDVFYNTPLRYGVKGASVNIQLDNSTTEKSNLNGEVRFSDIQRFYNSWEIGTNMAFTNKSLSINLGYNLSHKNDRRDLKLISNHTLENNLYMVNQKSITQNKYYDHNVYGDISWNVNHNASLTIAYLGQMKTPHATTHTNTLVNDDILENVVRNKSNDKLHNLDIELDYKKINIGADVTYYHQKKTQNLCNEDMTEDMNGVFFQKSIQTSVFLNGASDFSWGNLEYGISGGYSSTDNKNVSAFSVNESKNVDFYSSQYEKTLSAYCGFRKNLSKNCFFKISLQGEYFHSSLDSINAERRTTLWSDFHLYPQFTFMYKLKQIGTIQMTLNSIKRYPSYWSTASTRSYINTYCATEGNIKLKPYTHYGINLNYIIKNKYIFGFFADINDKYSTQLLIQDSKELLAIYKYYNFDYSNRFGLLAIAPIKWSNCSNSNFTFMLFDMQQKSKIEGRKFDREKVSSRINVTNQFSCRSKGLTLEVSGWYQFPIIQGIYNVKSMYNVAASMTYKMPIKGLYMIFKADDIFCGNKMRVRSIMSNQKYAFRNITDTRSLTITLRYAFNDFKKSKNTQFDNSRLGFK
ncbi:MAG: TonB-dependent receptor family protein [Prevotella sp.]|nr:TonB-dependent receptor family protein [Prevotella sp.]